MRISVFESAEAILLKIFDAFLSEIAKKRESFDTIVLSLIIYYNVVYIHSGRNTQNVAISCNFSSLMFEFHKREIWGNKVPKLDTLQEFIRSLL
jgi:hypothetical protein